MVKIDINKINSWPHLRADYKRFKTEFNEVSKTVENNSSAIEELKEAVSGMGSASADSNIPAGLITTITLDQSYTNDPLHVLITGDIACNKDENNNVIYVQDGDTGVTIPSMKPANENIISWIRANSRVVFGKWDDTYNALKICDLKDTGLTDLTIMAHTIDVFMKLPEFWYRVKGTDNKDIFNIEFTADYSIVNDGWNHWDGNTFIGVTKGFVDNNLLESNFANTTMHTVNVSQADFKNYAKKHKYSISSDTAEDVVQMTNYSLVTYEAHQIMALLFYAFYGDVDSQKICGAGANQTNRGINSTLLNNKYAKLPIMTDTAAADNAHNDIFWGLFDWWGDISEWIDNLVIVGLNGTMNNDYYEDYQKVSLGVREIGDSQDGKMPKLKRIIRNISSGDEGGNKLIIGKHFDIVPREDTIPPYNMPGGDEVDDPNTLAYASGFTLVGAVGSVGSRSGNGTNSDGGVGQLSVNVSSGADFSCGSRLQYQGDWIDVDYANL